MTTIHTITTIQWKNYNNAHGKSRAIIPTRQPKAGNLTRQTNLNTTCARGKRKHPSHRVTAYSYL